MNKTYIFKFLQLVEVKDFSQFFSNYMGKDNKIHCFST